MTRRIQLLLVLILISIMAVVAGCGNKADSGNAAATTSKLKVVTTIYPVYEFARQVGGDKIDVVMLIPPGAEPHDWEPSAKDLVTIKNAKLFLYNGAGFEPVAKLLTKEVLGSATAVEISKGLPLLKGSDEADEHDDDHKDGKQDKHQHEVDPHVWLDPVLAQAEVNNIAKALSEVDPANKDYYRQNADTFNAELAKLDEEFKTGLADVKRRDIVTSHAAFQYLAKRYNLKQLPIMGLAPDAEPTPDRLASVVKFCKEHNVKYIFFETLVSPKLAQTIAKETGAKLLVLNPVDGLTEEDIKKGRTYLSIMRENLANLKTALAQ